MPPSNLPHPIAGDLLLCRPTNKPKLNLVGQRLARPFYKSNYSHIAVAADINKFIHSTPSSGVDYIGLHQLLFLSEYRDNWKVYRNTALQEAYMRDSASTDKTVRDAIRYFYSQSYNYAFHVSERILKSHCRRHSFCSQLAERIYRRINVVTGTSKRSAAQVLPIDFERAVSNPSHWLDVTHIYKGILEVARRDPDYASAVLLTEKTSCELYRNADRWSITFAKKYQETATALALLDTTFPRIASNINELAEVLNIPFRLDESGEPDSLEEVMNALKELASENWQGDERLSEIKHSLKKMGANTD